jgi:hypothetical protein
VNSIPEKNTSYLGPFTDTSRWDDFKHRPDDIFICTPPKCGTTWTQAICAMLVFGKVDHGLKPGIISPWIDANLAPIDEYLEQVESQSHRRFIKTHTPLDGIPYYPECTYLVVVRDPRDVFISALNHRDNMTNKELALKVAPTSFDNWLTDDLKPGTWDVQTLSMLVDFFTSYWKYRNVSNIHIFHYADMKLDLKGSISAMAKALNIKVEADFLDAMTEAASFDSMKRNASQFAPVGKEYWKKESGFFAHGRNQQWKDVLTDAQLSAFNERLAQLLPSDQANWLLRGRNTT